MTDEAKTYRKETRNLIHTVTMFAWGYGWRVKYIVTDTNRHETHLLQDSDEDFETLEAARKAYTQIIMATEA